MAGLDIVSVHWLLTKLRQREPAKLCRPIYTAKGNDNGSRAVLDDAAGCADNRRDYVRKTGTQ